jgi:hypothetical protein
MKLVPVSVDSLRLIITSEKLVYVDFICNKSNITFEITQNDLGKNPSTQIFTSMLSTTPNPQFSPNEKESLT